jgi:glutamyl-tRNA synthetase
VEKARWFNHQYLIQKSNEELADLYLPILEEKGIQIELSKVVEVVGLIKERAHFVSEFWEQSSFFFKAPEAYDAKAVKKRWKAQSYDQMLELKEVLSGIGDFTSENTETITKNWIAEKEYGMGAIMNAFRLLIVGAPKGPHLFDIIAIIGKQETLERLEHGLNKLGRKES